VGTVIFSLRGILYQQYFDWKPGCLSSVLNILTLTDNNLKPLILNIIIVMKRERFLENLL
jgi:hypothetical protein